MRRDWGLGIWNLEGRLRLIKTLCCIFFIKNFTSRPFTTVGSRLLRHD